MFNSLSNIIYVEINYIFEEKEIDLSYMFYNCTNLKSIIFNSTNNRYITNMKGMFYNCISLTEVIFEKLSDYSYSYVDLSYMFYNCKNLTILNINFDYLKVSSTREMFYNCVSLPFLNFNPYKTSSQINMTKMLYNCKAITRISFSIYQNYYFYPIDMSFMFYNCYSLVSLELNRIKTDYTQYMAYLLYNCKSLTNLIFYNSNFSNYDIIDMTGIFQNCESLITLDLSNFYTPKVEIMWDMFKGCKSLQNLIILNFDTSQVTDMQSMFEGCSSLVTLNLNHFYTSKVQYMNTMFKDCVKLESLYFNQSTSESLGTMYRMFYNCSSLKYLNIFLLIEDVQSIAEIFEGTPNDFKLCIKDEKNIPNIFNIIYNKEKTTRDCSENCYHDSINRLYANETKQCCDYNLYNGRCYNDCPSRTKNINGNIECYNFSCHNYYNYEQNDCLDNISDGYYMNDSILRTIDKCDDNCQTCTNRSTKCLSCNIDMPYLYLNKCLNSCKYGWFEDNSGIKKCYCFEQKCKYCSEESMEYGLCESCNDGYYQKYNETFANDFINCYKDPEEYYFDSSESIYMPCYPSCKSCDRTGNKTNHYCTSCNSRNSYIIPKENNENFTNCYPICIFNFYFDDDNNYICLNTMGCPDFAPLLIDKTKECVKECNSKNKYIFRSTCFEECPIESKNYSNITGFYCISDCPFEKPFEIVEEQICVSSCSIMERYYRACITNYDGNSSADVQNMVLLDIKSDIIDTFNYSFITKDKNLIYEERNIIYEITSTQCEYHDPKTTIIYLGECESVLKMNYGIDENEPLYILKLDVEVEGKEGPKVEYEVYYPFNKLNLNQLDLSICEGIKIIIGYHVNISGQNLDLYNKNSDFYNDICYPYTSENGTDVTLEDRRKELSEKNKSICEEDCNFVGYDEITGILKCSCEVKLSISMISEIKIDNKNKLIHFMDITKISNFKVMKCIKLLFSKEGIITNIGFYSFFPVIIAYFVSSIVYNIKEYNLIIKEADEIVFSKKVIEQKEIQKKKLKTNMFKTYIIDKENQLEGGKGENIDNDELNTKKKHKGKKYNKIYDNFFSKNDEDIIMKELFENPFDDSNVQNFLSVKDNRMNENKSVKFSEAKNSPPKKNSINENKILKNKKNKNEEIKGLKKENIKEKLAYIDIELNELGYKKALKIDHRTFFQYYFSLMKTKHIIFQLFDNKDYNSLSIKILLLFFNFASNFAVNALFFSDETMHQISEDGGDYNIIYQLPQIVYSSIISMFIDYASSSLALSQDDILDIKKHKKVKALDEKVKRIKKMIRIKSIFFFITNFLFNLLFWYYLSCFCAVYKNTQYHLIKDTLISYGIGILTPFLTFLLPGILRIPSLTNYSEKKKKLYKLSKLLQNYL